MTARSNHCRQRILVVDDDGDIRRLNTEVLAGSGYKVDAADGASAWEILQLNSYDLLLTDHDMPKVAGVELLKKLHAARMTLPVILASGTIPMKELSRHPWLQIDATLLKPYTPDELLATVRKVLFATYGAAPDWQDQPSAVGMKISLQDSKTGKFMRCDSVWTAKINEALNFSSVRRAISFGMKELKEPFRVLQIRKNDLLGTVIIAISDLPRLPQFSFKGQFTASAVSLNRLCGDGQTDSIPAQLELTLHHRILVVDDDNDTRQLSVDVLAGSGYNIEVAKDGSAGWKALQSGNNYDLVVTDNKMPNMTGIEMIAKLRSARLTVPVIMATEHPPDREFTRKPWLRPDATLQRPFSNDDLLEMVKKVLHAAAKRR
jgi:two-component system chemotaxis response regulator CheY